MGTICNLELGNDKCRRKNIRLNCVFACKKLLELSNDGILEMLVSLAFEDIEIIQAKRGDERARNSIITRLMGLVDFIVDSTLMKIGNPRISMEKEDLKQEIAMVLEIPLKTYDRKRSQLGTHMRWQIRGELANLLRKMETDKRIINYLRNLASLQDVVGSSDEIEGIELEDVIGRLNLRIEEFEISDLSSQLSSEEGDVLRMVLDGYEISEIPLEMGISHIKLEDLIKSIREKISELLT